MARYGKKAQDESREGDARAEARHAEVGALRQEGDESKASHRDRPLRGAARRREGSEEEHERSDAAPRAHNRKAKQEAGDAKSRKAS